MTTSSSALRPAQRPNSTTPENAKAGVSDHPGYATTTPLKDASLMTTIAANRSPAEGTTREEAVTTGPLCPVCERPGRAASCVTTPCCVDCQHRLLTRRDGTTFDPSDANHLGDCLVGCIHPVVITRTNFNELVRAGLCTRCDQPMHPAARANPNGDSFVTHPTCDLEDGAA
jgi:hypothetical protein